MTSDKKKPVHVDYFESAKNAKEKLATISPTMCMAKWLQVSMHLPNGRTHSCYHPPAHNIPLSELAVTHKALHNTQIKVKERKQMLDGVRPPGCEYCWKIEDAPDGPHLSDRHYRSGEWWVNDAWDEVVSGSWDENINPRYVEVNFNQACNFKCTYCSPHLSTAWEQEINDSGPIPLLQGKETWNNVDILRGQGMMPIAGPNKDNPYINAFWEWWPDLYKDLKVFRMTGGEPLMDKNTFKVFKYINENPKNDLDLSITSNMCPPDQKLFDKFMTELKKIEAVRVWENKDRINPDTGNNWYVAPAIKHFSLFVSVDSVGKQAEYIRTGLDFNRMLENVRTVLRDTHGTEISFINTFNLLSIPKLKEFMQMVLDLRIEFGYENQEEVSITPPDRDGVKHDAFVRGRRQRVWFDVPYLHDPKWMSAQNICNIPEMVAMIDDVIEFMEDNIADENYGKTYHGFKDYEIAKMKRNRAWIVSGKDHISDDELKLRKILFWEYFNEIDDRRDQNFIYEFPELSEWWNQCFAEYNDFKGTL